MGGWWVATDEGEDHNAKELIHKSAAVLSVMMALAIMMPGTANATQAGAGAVVGTGGISPGLTTTPRAQTFTFSGTAAGVLASDSPLGVGGTCTVNASGGGFGNLTVGLGTGSATCTGINLVTLGNQTVGCAFAYQRVGAVLVITGGCIGVFVFVPTSVNPIVSFALVGGFALAG